MSNISQRIRYYRKRNGLTQMDIATGLGIRVDNYAKYESGARIPRADRLVSMAKIIGVSYDTLNEGIEREFADLLKSHAIGIITGEILSFSTFGSDMIASGEAYHIVSDFLNSSEYDFIRCNEPLYSKYIATPNMASLIELYGIYKDQCDPRDAYDHIGDISLKLDYQRTTLEPITTAKLAFCIAFKKYLERTESWVILDEVEAIAGDILDTINTLQFYGVKVFVPFLSFIIDAVELCMNTNMDDFNMAFLFNALTPPDDDEDDPDEGDE